MNNLNCEYVRDVYPDLLSGRLDSTRQQQVRAHIADCADCQAEVALIDAIHAEPLVLPAGLEQRIAGALRQRPRRWRFSAGTIAMAATLAAAVIGGSLIMRAQNDTPVPPQAAEAGVTTPRGLGAVGVDDALMSGKSSLDDLSVEQLEKLLGEIQS